MNLLYRILADLIVIIHMGYVLVVIFGLVATWIGLFFGWSWARNFWWRCGHLTMILIVVGEAWAGIVCPLTTWERQLRESAGQQVYAGSFVGNLVHDCLFYDLPPWAFTVIYTAFGSLVVLSFIVAPPRLPRRSKKV